MATATKTKKSVSTKSKNLAKATKVEAAQGGGEYGIHRTKDLPDSEKKRTVLGALLALGAVSEATAQGSTAVAEQGKVTQRDVRHYCYHAKAGGLVAMDGHKFYLTQCGPRIRSGHDPRPRKLRPRHEHNASGFCWRSYCCGCWHGASK